jgi:hypothetical protein
MADYPKFVKMQKMFQLKNNASSSKGKAIFEVKIIIANVNAIDVNVATKSKITKDHVFQEKELRNNNNNRLGKEDKLKKTMVEII